MRKSEDTTKTCQPHIPATGIDMIDDCLLVRLHSDEDGRSLSRLSRDILARLQSRKMGKVIINVSAIKVMDSRDFAILSKTARAISLMGGSAVFVGIQPGVASALVDLDLRLDQIRTAISAEDALALLQAQRRQTQQPAARAKESAGPCPPDPDAPEARTDD